MELPHDGRRRAVIEEVRPAVDCGRSAVKRVLGEPIDVEADVLVEGHERVACALLHAPAGSSAWTAVPMTPLGDDVWQATFVPDALGFGSITFNRVSSDNSTPTNEPVIGGVLLHELDPAFERFTSFNIPGPNYHQGETRFTFNYQRQITNWARIVETFGYRDVQLKFIDDGDFIGEPYSLANQTVTMYPFSQQADESIFYQEARLELNAAAGRMQHLITFGGSYERNKGELNADFIYTDEDLFGFPDISYVNPVIPDRSLWQHDVASRVYNLGITGLFGQYIVEPTPRVVVK